MWVCARVHVCVHVCVCRAAVGRQTGGDERERGKIVRPEVCPYAVKANPKLRQVTVWLGDSSYQST